MPNYTLTPIALAVLCLLSAPALADTAAPAAGAPANSPRKSAFQKDQPATVQADQIQGNPDEKVEADGNVEIHKGDVTLTAPRLQYDATTADAEADGPMCVAKPDMKVAGAHAQYNLDTDKGVVANPTFFLAKNHSRGDALRMVSVDAGHQRFEHARYTTCAPGHDDWFFTARDLELDRVTNTGVARDSKVVFKDHTILYLPYVDFPLDGSRRSGLLTPMLSSSSSNGFDFRQPYYWNIAPNMDATLTPRIITRRGADLGAEFRYMGDIFSGQDDLEYMPHDQQAGTDRYNITLKHNQSFGNGFFGDFDFHRVSDDAYFRDLSSRMGDTAQTSLPQMAELGWANDDWRATARVDNFQTLQDPAAPITPPYDRRQLLLNGHQELPRGADFQMTAETASFIHDTLPNGTRTTLNPSVRLPMDAGWGYVTPKIGLNYRSYAVDATGASPALNTSVTTPIVSVDSGLKFERDGQYHGQNYLQTLEPRLFYTWIPYRDQSKLPLFDTTESDFNFGQMFTENKFSGGDRLNDANQVTAAMVSRIIDPASGQERWKMAVGQRFELTPQQVTLVPGETTTRASELLASFSGRLTERWMTDNMVRYDPASRQLTMLNTGVSYQPAKGKVVNVSYRYTRDNTALSTLTGMPGAYLANDPVLSNIRQLDVSTQWPIADHYNLVARWDYSLQDKKILEGLAGVEYNGGCWRVRAVADRLVTGLTTSSNGIMFQLELGDIGQLGSNPLNLLKRDIPGYSRMTDEGASSGR